MKSLYVIYKYHNHTSKGAALLGLSNAVLYVSWHDVETLSDKSEVYRNNYTPHSSLAVYCLHTRCSFKLKGESTS